MRADHHLALGGCGGRHFVMSETQDFLASELTLGMYPPRIPLICFSECRYFRCTPFTLLWVFWVLLGRCVLGAAGAPSRQRDLVVHPKHPGKAHPEYRVTGKREKERPTQALIWCLRGAAEQRQLHSYLFPRAFVAHCVLGTEYQQVPPWNRSTRHQRQPPQEVTLDCTAVRWLYKYIPLAKNQMSRPLLPSTENRPRPGPSSGSTPCLVSSTSM
jgi:hypothetical protein